MACQILTDRVIIMSKWHHIKSNGHNKLMSKSDSIEQSTKFAHMISGHFIRHQCKIFAYMTSGHLLRHQWAKHKICTQDFRTSCMTPTSKTQNMPIWLNDIS